MVGFGWCPGQYYSLPFILSFTRAAYVALMLIAVGAYYVIKFRLIRPVLALTLDWLQSVASSSWFNQNKIP